MVIVTRPDDQMPGAPALRCEPLSNLQFFKCIHSIDDSLNEQGQFWGAGWYRSGEIFDCALLNGVVEIGKPLSECGSCRVANV
jgi:hypothetical protein